MKALRVAMAALVPVVAPAAVAESRIAARDDIGGRSLTASARLQVLVVVPPRLEMRVSPDAPGSAALSLRTNAGTVVRACAAAACGSGAFGTSGVNAVRASGLPTAGWTIAQP